MHSEEIDGAICLLAGFLAYNTTFNMVMKILVFAIAEILNGVFCTTAQSGRKSVPHKTQKILSDLAELFSWNHRFIIPVRVSNLIMLTTSCNAEAI